MKRFLALFLVTLLVLSVLPTSFATPKGQDAERDIWDIIEQIEDNAVPAGEEISAEGRTAAYNACVDTIIQAVVSSDDYQPDSLERHGNFFFWVDRDGDPNGYSPSLRARQRAGEVPGAKVEDFADTETVSYGTRGGWAESVDIAAFQPYIGVDSSFTDQYERRCNSLAQATGGTGTTYKTADANINNIGLALSNCGVVIYDSHGTTDYDNGSWYDPDYTTYANASYLCLTSGTGITAQDKQSDQGEFGTYYHAFQSGSTWCVDGTAMANHMPTDSPNGMLWMAICLGMATDKLQAPLRAKGVEVVYGYSQSVTFAGDYAYEGAFWPKMIDGDNVKDAIAYMKQTIGIKDPYESSLPAYPIVASSEDVYPGHGNVDKAQTVNSIWTLYPQYTVTAYTDQPEFGSVSVRGDSVIAFPADGYCTIGYELVEGLANVTQDAANENVFHVEALSDCTIRVDFAAKTPAVVSFSTPEGVSCDPIEAYVGDTITMPEPTGNPTAVGYTFNFLGWVSAAVNDTMDQPEYVKAGAAVKLTQPNPTYYALYSYFVAQNGLNDDQFIRVDEDPDDWSGEYVISYNGQYALMASPSCAASKLGSSSSVVDLEARGCVYENNILNGVTEDLTWVIDPAEDGSYTIKMKSAYYYLALASNTNSLTSYTSSNTNKTRWSITVGPNGAVITNKAYTERFLQYNNGLFRCYTSKMSPITLFAKPDGDSWFTTAPKDKVVCNPHSFGDWVVEREVSCTEVGLRYRVCSVCGYKETETQEALGHSYQDEIHAPNCTEQGYTVHTCSRCGDSYTDAYVDALGHEFSEWTVTAAPSCTEDGEESRMCARCLLIETRSLAAAGHNWGEPVWYWIIPDGSDSNENLTVSAVFTCTACEARVVKAADVTETDTLPSCTEDGRKGILATVVFEGETYTDSREQITPALGHDFSEWTVIEMPSCTEDGVESRLCKRCQQLETRAIPATGHEWSEPVYVWDETEEGWFCTASVRCLHDETHVESERVAAAYREIMAPTYLAAGEALLTADFTDSRFADQQKELELPQLDPIVITFLPGAAGDAPVPGEAFSISTANPGDWSEDGSMGAAKFFDQAGTPWFGLPEPMFETPEGYRFLGWVTEGDSFCYPAGHSNVAYTASYVAQWVPEYKINTVPMDEIAEWLDIQESAVVDQQISLTVNLLDAGWEEGYRLEKLVISDPQGNVLQELTTDLSGQSFLEAGPIEAEGMRLYSCSFTMPASDVVISAVFREPAHVCKITHFEDVMQAYPYGTLEHDAIEWAYTHNVTAGLEPNLFGIDETVTRAQAMMFLWAALGRPEPQNVQNPFVDVASNKWYFKPIMWAVENKITAGVDSTHFGVNETCNRAQILTFLRAYAHFPNATIENPYSDIRPGKYPAPAALWAYEEGFELGENGKFNGNTPCTRCSTIVYIYKYLLKNNLIN